MESENVIDIVKAEPVIDAVDDTVVEVEAETLSDLLAKEKAEALVT